MNPFDLDATGLLIWGIVVHLICDWPLQNDWMANNKAKRLTQGKTVDARDRAADLGLAADHRERYTSWWARHPAAYVHATIHFVGAALVFGFWPGLILAVVHLIIDCRWVVVKWSQLIKQTQPEGATVNINSTADGTWKQNPDGTIDLRFGATPTRYLYDVGTEVRFWTDQVFHIATIAVAALIVGAL